MSSEIAALYSSHVEPSWLSTRQLVHIDVKIVEQTKTCPSGDTEHTYEQSGVGQYWYLSGFVRTWRVQRDFNTASKRS